MRRVAAWLAGVSMLVWQGYAVQRWGLDEVQGWVYASAAVVAVVFIVLYSRDPWRKTRLGRSLMLLAAAVLVYGVGVVFDFGLLFLAAADAMLVAMVMRTVVLWQAQRHDRDERLP